MEYNESNSNRFCFNFFSFSFFLILIVLYRGFDGVLGHRAKIRRKKRTFDFGDNLKCMECDLADGVCMINIYQFNSIMKLKSNTCRRPKSFRSTGGVKCMNYFVN